MFENLYKTVKSEELSVMKGTFEELYLNSRLSEVWDDKNKSLLHVAVKYRGYDVVCWLLDTHGFGNALVRDKFDDIIHSIVWSISNSHDDDFEEKCSVMELVLLFRPELVNKRDCFQRTPLHVAVAWEFKNSYQLQLVQILIQNNADVDAVDHVRKTPLHKAVDRITVNPNLICLIKLLVSSNADLIAVDHLRRTFLHLAAIAVPRHIFQHIVEYLDWIHRTDCFTTLDLFGSTVLHYALENFDPSFNTLITFKRYNFNLHARDDSGKSLLAKAIHRDRGSFIQFFTIHGNRSILGE